MGLIFERVTRRKLGVTHEAVNACLVGREAAGEFDGWTTANLAECLAAHGQVLALNVAADIRSQHANAWCEVYEAGQIDWEALLEFIAKLIEMLMPLIIKKRPNAARPA